MEASWFVGIAEACQESICLFHVKVHGTLPDYCNCKEPAKWNSFTPAHENYGVKPHSLDDYSAEVLKAVDSLSEEDHRLYHAACKRLVQEIQSVEHQFGMQILCRGDAPAGGVASSCPL